MLEPSLVTDAIAATGEVPGLPGLGPYPILQLFGGIISLIVLAGGALLYLKAQNVPAKSTPSNPMPPGGAGEGTALAEVFVQGPFTDIQSKLAAYALVLEKLAALHYETREQIAQALQITRHDFRDALGADAIEASKELNDIAESIAELQRGLAVLSERFGLLDQFVRIKIK